MAGKRVSKAEADRRKVEVLGMLRAGATHKQIFEHAEREWGIKQRQAEDYIARATAVFSEEMKRQGAELVAEHVIERRRLRKRLQELAEESLEGEKPNMQAAVSALKAAAAVLNDEDKLLDLYAPERLEVSAETTVDPSSMTREERLAYLAARGA